MSEKIQRLSEWARGGMAGPLTLELNPTNRCNLKCTSCWQREFDVDYTRELSTDKLISIVKEAKELGVKEFRIPGAGEPFLKEGLLEVMQEVKNSGMHGMLITNGTLLGPDHARRLIEMGWDVVTVSLDSPDEKTNDALRGTGSFARAKRAIELLAGHNKPHLRINTVLTNKNYMQLEQLIKLANSLGVKDVQVQPMTVWGKDGRTLELNEREREALGNIAEKAVWFALEKGIFTNISEFAGTRLVENAASGMDAQIKSKEEKEKHDSRFLSLPCFEPFYNMIILPDGKIAACSISGGVDGDNLHDKTLKEVWNGEKFREIRKSLLSGDLKDYCRKCCSAVHMENNRIRDGLKINKKPNMK